MGAVARLNVREDARTAGNYFVGSNQMLLNDKRQRIHVVDYAAEARCLVFVIAPCFALQLANQYGMHDQHRPFNSVAASSLRPVPLREYRNRAISDIGYRLACNMHRAVARFACNRAARRGAVRCGARCGADGSSPAFRRRDGH